MRKYFLLFCCLTSLSVSIAQVDNRAFENRTNIDSNRTNWLYLSIYNYNYQRNYEYFNRFADGLTYYGLQLQPELNYYASPNLTVSAGIHLRKDFGNNGIYDKQPLFKINYHKNNFQLINGAIQGNVSHRLPEPLYDYDRIIYEPLEYGTQFLYKDSNLFFDAWINWEKMIYKISPEQERISGGISAEYTLINTDAFEFSIPFHGVAFHKGGQIDTPDHFLITILNTAVGFKANFKMNGVLKSIHTENYYFTYKDFSFTKVNPFLQGNGLLLNAGFKFKPFDLIFSYWKGSGYQSVHGADLYQSVSSHINHAGYVEADRELLFVRLISDYQLADNFYIGTRIEPYIDLKDPQLEFSNSLYLVYKDDFRLFKGKRRP